MCFANAVLQILLYCAPFHRLFLELGKLLPAVATQKDGASSGSSAPSASSSATPLVEATVTFLKEFVTPKKPLLINGKSGVMSGVASGSGYGRGNKGKEREMIEMDDDWDLDSFLPTYIYDAMKEKKRFDTMRVSLFLDSFA
jgi:ubiquitin carboxyl-terminal hydrolase 10